MIVEPPPAIDPHYPQMDVVWDETARPIGLPGYGHTLARAWQIGWDGPGARRRATGRVEFSVGVGAVALEADHRAWQWEVRLNAARGTMDRAGAVLAWDELDTDLFGLRDVLLLEQVLRDHVAPRLVAARPRTRGARRSRR